MMTLFSVLSLRNLIGICRHVLTRYRMLPGVGSFVVQDSKLLFLRVGSISSRCWGNKPEKTGLSRAKIEPVLREDAKYLLCRLKFSITFFSEDHNHSTLHSSTKQIHPMPNVGLD